MKRSLFIAVLFLSGCAHFERGNVKLSMLGTDMDSKTIDVSVTTSNGCVVTERWMIKGGSVNNSRSSHTFANMTLAIAGGFGGFAVGNIPGAVAGASAGAGGSELIQKWLDKAKAIGGSK